MDSPVAHNERHPDTGAPTAKVIHNFRPDKVDQDALKRLVSSISRFLTPEQAASAAAGVEVEVARLPPSGGGLDVGSDLGTARTTASLWG